MTLAGSYEGGMVERASFCIIMCGYVPRVE